MLGDLLCHARVRIDLNHLVPGLPGPHWVGRCACHVQETEAVPGLHALWCEFGDAQPVFLGSVILVGLVLRRPDTEERVQVVGVMVEDVLQLGNHLRVQGGVVVEGAQLQSGLDIARVGLDLGLEFGLALLVEFLGLIHFCQGGSVDRRVVARHRSSRFRLGAPSHLDDDDQSSCQEGHEHQVEARDPRPAF